MSALIAALSTTTTENGAITLPTSKNDLTDLFFEIGAMRNRSEADVLNAFWRAWKTSPTLAMRCAFYARDIRGGQGERKTFRIILKDIATRHPEVITVEFIHWIVLYGRWDDTLVLVGTEAEKVLFKTLSLELGLGNSLLAKWLPREKSRKKALATKIRKGLGMDSKTYRKTLSGLSKVVETQMCSRDWGAISYGEVPSQAALRYRKAFDRNDSERYQNYLSAVENGDEEIKASTLYPHQFVKQYGRSETIDRTLEAQWKSLPDYMEGSENPHILPVVDTSGSMEMGMGSVTPIDVSVGLGLYLAERNKGAFKDHFVTFSSTPQLQSIEGETLLERITNLQNADWGMSTDLNKTFRFILYRAIDHEVSEEEMPSMILVLSDMEFDSCSESKTNFEVISSMYSQAGYTMPQLVFWNLNAKGSNFPVRFDESGTALVSGFSPSIMKHVLQSKGELTPYKLMMQVLEGERYGIICV